MESPLLFFLILTTITFTDPVHSQIIYPSENPVPLWGNVTIISNTNITLGTWTFDNNLLALIYPGGFCLSIAKRDRFIYDSSTSSLTIISAQLADSGVYKLEEMDTFSVQVQLSVQEPISNVTLSAQRTDLVEFNNTAVFVCSVSTGTSLSYKWLASDSEISTGAGVQLSNGGANLSIVGLTRSDEGPYMCNVSNGLGYEVSPPVSLNISYGANNATMTVDPVKYMYRSGSNITLSCSVESKPTAMVQWMFDGVNLNQFGLQLHLQNVKKNNTGTYTCLFHNTVTMRFSSDSTVIRVMDPISAVVMSEANGPAVLDKAFSLQCEATGLVDSIQWWKNGSRITPDNRTTFGNKTLTLNPVQLSDGGLYMCQVFNLVSNLTSDPFAVVVNYGPMKPTVMGPNVVKSGNTATFNCSAESVPPSLYQWHFNGSVVSNMSEYTTPSLTKDMSGEYICMALNTITGKNSTASIMLRVIDPIRNVQVEAQMNLAVEGHPYNLTCRVNETVDHIYWMRNGEKLNPDNRTTILMENMTMSFMSMQRNDTGNYTCLAANAVGNMTSKPFMLLVNYGPDTPVIMGPRAVQTGGNATLRCHAKSVPPSLYQWHFNGSVVSNMSEYTTPPLTKDMSWKYTCMALNTITGKNSSASMMLAVVDPIQSVEIQAQMNSAMENYSHNLTCNVVGPADYIYWMKSGNLLLADNRTVFDMNNKTVMFLALNSSDSGHYQCVAVNALGNMTSADYTLHVIYGPKMPTISGPKAVKPGSSATLSCYAPSYPPSFYRWYFNDTLVSNMSEYMTPPVTEEKSLKYTCMAFNNITGKNSSASITITAIASIKNVQIDTPTSDAMEGHSYNLMCNVTGDVDNIYWMKNGEQIHQDNSTVFSMDNKTVNFMPVDRYDAGHYVCMAVNAVGNLTSSAYLLQVIFGPDEPIIHGPEFGEAGRNAVFNCSAASMPPSTYSWWFNGSLMANTSEFTAGPLSFNMSGTYTCVAHNHVTEKNSTTSTMLTVIEGIDSVMIQNNLTPISNENFTLTCRVVGPYDALYWMKDGMQLSLNASDPAPSLYITEDNILHFTQLTTQSNGAYQCVATNKAALHKSQQYKLLVHYGPLNMNISGPGSAKDGAVVSLNCTVDSYPECDFYWFLNNKSSLLKIGSVFNFSATRGQVGDYICVAKNPVTNVTMTQTKSFTIENHASANHITNKGAVLLMGLCSVLVHLLLL
ncbi:carcinoembryonic antigen-related cell adhesion molecule 1 [Poecilia formosa]|uniref:Hemicentin-1-like n=1 Tax=Poecilia formosa TaxID=48698 RepID=A0A087X785_POEFO|nr:PREDICTED: hemicentin-1-like [Poecilia formosa]